MFYVIYNPVTKQYADAEGKFGSFDKAEQFASSYDAEFALDTTTTGLKVVGPCEEGEKR